MNLKYFKATCLILLASTVTYSQEYKLTKTSGQIHVNFGNVEIVAHNGNDIVITYNNSKKSEKRGEVEGVIDDSKPAVRPQFATAVSGIVHNNRNKGLRVINASGLQDNTGFGIHLLDNGGNVELERVGKTEGKAILVKVPKAMTVKVSSTKLGGEDILLKDIDKEIEAAVLYNNIILQNVTGPMTIKTTYGNVEGKLGSNLKSPISIISTYNDIDLLLPKDLKANVNFDASYGDVYADTTINIVIDKIPTNNKYTNDAIKGKINGGGIDFSIKSNYGKIYLRN